MQDKITVIITIRNREAWRIENAVQSIRAAGANPAFHIVDYGSSAEYAAAYRKICDTLNIRYIYTYTQGLPWSRSRALNCGVKPAQTEFIVTTDADMIYESNPFQYCLDNYKEKTMYHMETYWLPKNGNKAKSVYAGHGNSGGFQFIARSAFDEIGGYDERMLYWGVEDLDFPDRLKKIGYTQIWLPQDFKLYHQWHPVSEANCKRPQTATVNTLKFAWENHLTPIRQDEWGTLISETDRPILKEMRENKPAIIELVHGECEIWQTADKVLSTKKDKFIKLELGKRMNTRLFPRIKASAKLFLKPGSAFDAINLPINKNFDILYEMLPMLFKNGLRDYYIYEDLSAVYLLWN